MQEADSGASGYEHTVETIDSTRDPSQAADADVGTMGNLEGLSKLQEPEHVSGEAKLADLSFPRPVRAAWLHVLHAAEAGLMVASGTPTQLLSSEASGCPHVQAEMHAAKSCMTFPLSCAPDSTRLPVLHSSACRALL